MADFKDVVRTRGDADDARRNCEIYGAAIEEGERTVDAGLAIMLAAVAVVTELRALGTTLDYASLAVRA